MTLFISYSSQDHAAIESLKSALHRARQQVWLDEELGGGEAWWRTILDQIRNCQVFIVALSDNSLASKPCQAELRYAQALQRPILPVQIGPVASMRVTPLAATQIIDYRNPTADAGIQLVAGVHERRAQLQPLPSPLPEEPPVPFAYLMRLATTIADSQLDARQQAELVADLKAGLEEDGDDPAARSDIEQLLCRLRDRPDVTWRTRTDIETILASIDAKSKTTTIQLPPRPAQPAGQQPSGRPMPPRPWPATGRAAQPEPATPGATSAPSMGSGPQPVMSPPGPGFPHDYPGAPAKGRRSRAPWFIGAGVGAAIVVALVTVLALIGGRDGKGGGGPVTSSAAAGGAGTTSSTTAVPPLAPERLQTVLLTAAEINSIMGASTMEPGKLGEAAASASTELSQPECLGALYAGLVPTYAGSGYTALNYLVLAEPGDDNDHYVDQDAATFPSAASALAFVKNAVGQWTACAGQTVNVTYDNGKSYGWTLGNLVGGAPKITQLDTQEGGDGWACQRALSAVSNVVVDVKACGFHITDEANRIADKMATNVTG